MKHNVLAVAPITNATAAPLMPYNSPKIKIPKNWITIKTTADTKTILLFSFAKNFDENIWFADIGITDMLIIWIICTASVKSGNKIGSLSFNNISTGRNLTQAYANSLTKIKTYIFENLDELYID